MVRDSRNSGGAEKEVLEKVKRTLHRYTMVACGDTVVVGVSGGIDSISLLDILHRLQVEYHLRLVVAHLHHGLRAEEADREFRFVEGVASGYGVPFEGQKVAPASYAKGTNTQAQARRLRYRFYEEMAQRWGATKIATGHHQDDHAETLLIQILRGTGGLKGILPVREGRYIRPLIEIRRDEIEAYAKQRGLAHCQDSSNLKKTYLRNRIRQELVPWIRKEVNPSFSEPLLQLASILREEAECLDTLAEEALEGIIESPQRAGEVILKRDLLERMPRAIQRRVLRHSYRRLVGSTEGLCSVHLESVCEALATRGGRVHKVFPLPGGVRAFLEYDVVCFSRRDLWKGIPYEYPFCVGQELLIPEAGILLRARRIRFDPAPPGETGDRNRACLDAGLSEGTMVVRNFRPGDRFHPLGLAGEKKLKDFFIDEKISRSLRHRIPVLEIGGRIAWVIGYRIDDRFKVSEKTRKGIQIEAVKDGQKTAKP